MLNTFLVWVQIVQVDYYSYYLLQNILYLLSVLLLMYEYGLSSLSLRKFACAKNNKKKKQNIIQPRATAIAVYRQRKGKFSRSRYLLVFTTNNELCYILFFFYFFISILFIMLLCSNFVVLQSSLVFKHKCFVHKFSSFTLLFKIYIPCKLSAIFF